MSASRDIIHMCIGAIAGLAGSFLVDYDGSPRKEQIDQTYKQLKEMKAECEKDLPRSTECSIVVYYQPQAELEKTE
jgi:hypothetical protein